ncbi:MAG: EamA family transporter, partial [Thermoanaerobaculia bacterium]|nr:EamA family transporter [Thermoanaerobaculia bacterium]
VPVLGERITAAGAGGIALVLAGVWLVQTDGRLELRRLWSRGLGFAYLTLAMTVAYSLVDKRAMEVLDAMEWGSPAPRAVVFYYLLAAGHLPFFWLLARRRLTVPRLGRALRGRALLVAGAVAASLTSYSLILEALRSAPVSYVVAARQSSVVFAVLLATLWLRESPSRPRLVGISLTVAGVVLVALA